VVLENLAPPAFTQPMAKAVAKGVPVVALDTEPSPGSNVTLYVGNDNYALGVSLAQEAIKLLPAQASGTIVVNNATRGVPMFMMRAKGIMDTLAKALPHVKLIEVYTSCMDATPCSSGLLPIMRANSHALAFLGTADVDSYTLAQLKKQLGGKYLTAAFDLDPRTMQAVKDGTNFCTISPEHYLKGYIATRLLAEAVKTGKPLPKGWFDEPGLVVDQSLIGVIMERQSSDANMRAWLRPEIARIFADTSPYMKPLSAAR
jgi:ribose transport system substrate-binding protein